MQLSWFLQAEGQQQQSRKAYVTYTHQECTRLRLQALQKHDSKSWAAMGAPRMIVLQIINHPVEICRDTRVETLAGHGSTEMPYHAECVLEYPTPALQILHTSYIHTLE